MTERAAKPGSKEAILDAATALIRKEGVAGLAIADVIAASGTSAGSIYHHFKSRHELVLAVAKRALVSPLESALREPQPELVAPAELFEAAVQRVLRDEGTAELLIQIWAGMAGDAALRQLINDEVSGLHWAVAAQLRAWCVAQDRLKEAHSIAQLVVGLVAGLVVQKSLLADSFDPPAYLAMGRRVLSDV